MRVEWRGADEPRIRSRSAKEYKAQTLGAQYAWHKPLLKGNRRLNS